MLTGASVPMAVGCKGDPLDRGSMLDHWHLVFWNCRVALVVFLWPCHVEGLWAYSLNYVAIPIKSMFFYCGMSFPMH